MNNEIDDIIKYVKTKKNLLLPIVSILVIVMIIISSVTSKSDKQEPETTTSQNMQTETQVMLEELISGIKGVGNVKVMITYKSSGEYVYAENSKSETNGDRQSSNSEIVLYESQDGNDEGLIVSVKNPDISGVAIICDGGNNVKIKAEITELITKLFGIGADRVYVGTNTY